MKSETGMRLNDAQIILDSIRRIVRALRISSRSAEKELGLSGAQLFVLQKLSGVHALSLNELASRTVTHQSSVSVVVSRLVERKLVTRTHSKTDARRIELQLTPRGGAILKDAPPSAQENLMRAIGEMSEPARKKLAGMLVSVVSMAGLSAESPSLFFEDEKISRKSGKRK